MRGFARYGQLEIRTATPGVLLQLIKIRCYKLLRA